MAKINDRTDEELLFQILSVIRPMPLALSQQISAYLKVEKLPKKHLLVRQGEVSRKIYFIARGFSRSFFHDREGREHTLRFSGKMDLLVSVYSFYTLEPACESIELLEDSTLISMTWDQLQSIYGEYPEFNYHGRILTERYYVQSELRAVIIRTKKLQDRYQLFLKHFPTVIKRAPLGQIASFLNITQETLSRIRAVKRI
jgi:CRP-like cAMP-binding protein